MLRSAVLLLFGLLLFSSRWVYTAELSPSSELSDEHEKKGDLLAVSRQKSIKKVDRDARIAGVAFIDPQTYKLVRPELPNITDQQMFECGACEHEAASELPCVDASNEEGEKPVEIQIDLQPVGRQRSITGGSGSLKTVSIPLLKIHGGGHSSSNLYENTHSSILTRNSHEPAVRAIAKASGDGLKSTRLCPFHRQVKGDTPIPTKRAEVDYAGSPLVCAGSNDTSPDADPLIIQFESKLLLTPESRTIDETLETVGLVSPIISSSSSEEEIVRKAAAIELAMRDQESKEVGYEELASPDSPGPIMRLAITKQMFDQRKCESNA